MTPSLLTLIILIFTFIFIKNELTEAENEARMRATLFGDEVHSEYGHLGGDKVGEPTLKNINL